MFKNHRTSRLTTKKARTKTNLRCILETGICVPHCQGPHMLFSGRAK